MYWLRSKKTFRVVVAFLTATLLPMLVAPTPRAGGQVVSEDYGEWLRSQVRAPVDEAFENALASAHEAQPESLTDFLNAFVEAYSAIDPEGSLTDMLAVPNMSTDALLIYLQTRTVGTRGLPLASPAAVLCGNSFAVGGAPGTSLGVLSGTDLPFLRLVSQGPVVDAGSTLATPLHVLFAAQPRGP